MVSSLPQRLGSLLRNDAARWRVLGQARALGLPDCWVGAGFVRNAAWDHLHGRSAPHEGDVDVLWFCAGHADPAADGRAEEALRIMDPATAWSVRNQARMHRRNGDRPYRSTADAMRFWPETATAVAVRRTREDACEILAPFGLDDLFGLVVRPAPAFAAGAKLALHRARVERKAWLARWPGLRLAPP